MKLKNLINILLPFFLVSCSNKQEISMTDNGDDVCQKIYDSRIKIGELYETSRQDENFYCRINDVSSKIEKSHAIITMNFDASEKTIESVKNFYEDNYEGEYEFEYYTIAIQMSYNSSGGSIHYENLLTNSSAKDNGVYSIIFNNSTNIDIIIDVSLNDIEYYEDYADLQLLGKSSRPIIFWIEFTTTQKNPLNIVYESANNSLSKQGMCLIY